MATTDEIRSVDIGYSLGWFSGFGEVLGYGSDVCDRGVAFIL